jgi:Radial spoke protein 3
MPIPLIIFSKDRLAESDVGVQTERDIWPPIVAPRQVPDTYGVDKSTQILPDDPDLFVFDEEVVVVLEALVGKTLEQGLLEVVRTCLRLVHTFDFAMRFLLKRCLIVKLEHRVFL